MVEDEEKKLKDFFEIHLFRLTSSFSIFPDFLSGNLGKFWTGRGKIISFTFPDSVPSFPTQLHLSRLFVGKPWAGRGKIISFIFLDSLPPFPSFLTQLHLSRQKVGKPCFLANDSYFDDALHLSQLWYNLDPLKYLLPSFYSKHIIRITHCVEEE